MSNAASFSLPLDESSGATDREAETTPDGKEPVRWEVVAQTSGLLPARIIADRLQSEGIPVRAWQESVGQAFGMTVGPLGTGYVAVPESLVEKALEILEANDASSDYRDHAVDDEIW